MTWREEGGAYFYMKFVKIRLFYYPWTQGVNIGKAL